MRSRFCMSVGACLLAATLGAAETVKYQAPEGFGGRRWGELLSTFTKFPAEPLSVGASWTRGKVTAVNFNCMARAPTMPSATDAQSATNAGNMVSSGAAEACDMHGSRGSERTEGGGFHVLLEHRIEGQGFKFGKDGVLLYPVVWQFCANWDSVKKEMPPDFDKRAQFCGMRLMFKGETNEELAQLPDSATTRYDRVLDALIAKYGQPSRFQKRGRVTIEGVDDAGVVVGNRTYKTWRWCPPLDRALATSCDASVTLAYDGEKRWGTVLYSAPPVWAYAYAREAGDFKGEELYAMLHGRRPPTKSDAEPVATAQ